MRRSRLDFSPPRKVSFFQIYRVTHAFYLPYLKPLPREHIFRQHCLPIHCHRCCTIFKIESDLAAHQRLPQGCEVRVLELPEGCSKEQEKLLRKRKRGSGSEENKWKDMFQCLFPEDNEDMIPTPCKQLRFMNKEFH
jgi:hypothetical protein